jgi:hypothetical protein
VEPTSADGVAQWIQTAQRQRDPFEHVRLASHEHRESHGAAGMRSSEKSGADGARTRGLRHAMAALSQLSYGPFLLSKSSGEVEIIRQLMTSFWLLLAPLRRTCTRFRDGDRPWDYGLVQGLSPNGDCPHSGLRLGAV